MISVSRATSADIPSRASSRIIRGRESRDFMSQRRTLRSSLPLTRISSLAVKVTHVIRLVWGVGEFPPKRRSVVLGVWISQRNGPERSAEEDAKCVFDWVTVIDKTG